jgi:hypothetical protein
MADKQTLLQDADHVYTELTQAVAGLTDAELSAVWLGTWGVREILMHIAGWNREMTPALQRIGRGELPYPPGTYEDTDGWNARFVEARQGVKPADLLAEVETSHRDFVAAAALSEEPLASGPARDLVEGVVTQHYREHIEQIRAWRRRPMVDALHAAQPDGALAAKLHLYGQFVGSWDLDVELHPPGGSTRRAGGEWHFSWVLGGKAIQDVWIFPARRLREEGRPADWWHMYGSTFRWYDAAIDAWHITWFDPTRPAELRQIGRAVGADIVQVGEDRHGLLRRWRFVEITSQSFRWLGEVSWDKGATWTLDMEMRARRVP